MFWSRRLLLCVPLLAIVWIVTFTSGPKASSLITSLVIRLRHAFNPPALVITWLSDSLSAGRESEYEIAQANREEYCSRHKGYELVYQDARTFAKEGRHVVWSKWPAIRRIFYEWPRTEWVVWMDEDILITNPDIALLDYVNNLQSLLRPGVRIHPEHINDFVWSDQRFPRSQDASHIDLVITIDGNAINAGIFMIRNTAWSRRLLTRLEDQWLIDQPWPLRENQALIYLIEHDHGILEKTGIVPQRAFNSYREGPEWMRWQPGDFAIHLVSCHWDGICKELYDEWYWRRIKEQAPP